NRLRVGRRPARPLQRCERRSRRLPVRGLRPAGAGVVGVRCPDGGLRSVFVAGDRRAGGEMRGPYRSGGDRGRHRGASYRFGASGRARGAQASAPQPVLLETGGERHSRPPATRGRYVVKPRIAVVVLNWCAYDHTVQAVESIMATPSDDLVVVIVDNAS